MLHVILSAVVVPWTALETVAYPLNLLSHPPLLLIGRLSALPNLKLPLQLFPPLSILDMAEDILLPNLQSNVLLFLLNLDLWNKV